MDHWSKTLQEPQIKTTAAKENFLWQNFENSAILKGQKKTFIGKKS